MLVSFVGERLMRYGKMGGGRAGSVLGMALVLRFDGRKMGKGGFVRDLLWFLGFWSSIGVDVVDGSAEWWAERGGERERVDF